MMPGNPEKLDKNNDGARVGEEQKKGTGQSIRSYSRNHTGGSLRNQPLMPSPPVDAHHSEGTAILFQGLRLIAVVGEE